MAAHPTAPYRIRPSVVRDGLAGQFGTENGPVVYARFILATGPHAAAATARSSCRVAGASGSWWRIVVAQAATEVHEGEVAAEQMRHKPDSSGGRQVPGN